MLRKMSKDPVVVSLCSFLDVSECSLSSLTKYVSLPELCEYCDSQCFMLFLSMVFLFFLLLLLLLLSSWSSSGMNKIYLEVRSGCTEIGIQNPYKSTSELGFPMAGAV